MKTTIYSALITLILNNLIFAQTPNWQWAKSAGDYHYDNSNGIISDNIGNVYIIGDFNNSITFGTITLNSTTILKADIFITKYDKNGNVLWAKNFGGNDEDVGINISIDPSGDLYMFGYYVSDSITFGNITLTGSHLYRKNYFAKFDSNGNIIWAKNVGFRPTCPSLMTIDLTGNIYIACSYYDTLTLGNITLISSPVNNSIDLFIAKYDNNGNILWAKGYGAMGNDYWIGLKADATGNILASGSFQYSSLPIGTFILANLGNDDAFVTKIDTNGNVIWAKRAGSTGYDYGGDLTIDNKGNTYVEIKFYDSITYIDTSAINFGSSKSRLCIVKFDSIGNSSLINYFGSTIYDRLSQILIDSSGAIYIAGSFKGDSIILGTTTLFNSSNLNLQWEEIFIAKCDTNGNFLWAKSAAGNKGDYISSMAIDHDGDIYITGEFVSPTLSFGNITLNNGNTGGYYYDVFIAKLSCLPTTINESELKSSNSKIYPNPNNGTFSINNLEKESSIEIYDISGRIVFRSSFKNNTEAIDLSTNEKGVYFYKIISDKSTKGGEMQQGKLIIQ